jgi:hypothetical protein
VVIFFIEMMRALLVPASGAKPEKFSQIAALYCLFRLRRMEGMGGPDGACRTAQNAWTFGFTRNFELRFGQDITLPIQIFLFLSSRPILFSPSFVVAPHCNPDLNSLYPLPSNLQVVSLLMDCIEPVEAAFLNRFAQIEEQDPSNFLKLQQITPFNSSVGAPLSQRPLVESGGALAWWMALVKEVADFTETMKLNRKHKGRQPTG